MGPLLPGLRPLGDLGASERYASTDKGTRTDKVAQGHNVQGMVRARPCNIKYPSYLSGMNVKLAGRLMTQSMRPRFTVQSFQEGSLARVKVHFIEKSRFTGKNKRGAFSFTITLSHVFNK